MDNIQHLSIILVIIVIASLTLLALGRMQPLLFWLIIIISAIMAFKVIPKYRKSN